MKAAYYEKNGTAREVLHVGEVETPQAGPGEVRVKVAVSGVNPSDVKTRAGTARKIAFPRVIPHSDGAGTIEAVGADLPASRVGERVWLWNAQWKRAFGTAAEYAALPSEQAVRLPDGVGFEAGACLGIPALTAWRAATIDGGVAGRTVLVAGGAGAVGHYAVQFAKHLGAAKVIGTVGSAENAQRARAAGADHVIDYKAEPVVDRIRELTGGRGVDRVIEVDLAANAALLPQVVAQDGICVAYGSGQPQVTLPFGQMILSGAAIRFFIVYELAPDVRAAALEQLSRWLEEGWIRHEIGAVLPLSDVVEAHERVEQNRVKGSLVLAC